MADKKNQNQMSEEQLDKVAGGMKKQYVLTPEEYEHYIKLKSEVKDPEAEGRRLATEIANYATNKKG